jgi:CheY-like chemotaxis protein
MTDNRGASPPVTVLLVEDHVDSRLMYAEFLRLQFSVLEAGDGVGALQLMQETVPAIVVTDLSLPLMDGFELVARMRRDPRLSGVPVIALSGYSGPEHEARAREVGADVILQKPCLPDALAGAVVSAIRSRKEVR